MTQMQTRAPARRAGSQAAGARAPAASAAFPSALPVLSSAWPLHALEESLTVSRDIEAIGQSLRMACNLMVCASREPDWPLQMWPRCIYFQ